MIQLRAVGAGEERTALFAPSLIDAVHYVLVIMFLMKTFVKLIAVSRQQTVN